MDELKIAWEAYLIDSDQAKLLTVVEKFIPADFDPDYELSDEGFKETMRTPYLASHRICDIKLCGRAFRVGRTSDESEILSIQPCASPSFDEPGVPYSLTGEKLLNYIHERQQRLIDECDRDDALNAPVIPVCGPMVRLMQEDKQNDCYGEVVIDSKELESRLIELNAHHSPRDKILEWIANRDDSVPHQVLVPKLWQGDFQYIANDMLRNGNATVWCVKCHRTYKNANLNEGEVESHSVGSFYNRLFCPENHKLLEIEVLHVCF